MEPPILCTLAEDSDFADLAVEFVESLGAEMARLADALAAGEIADVAMIAHKLRGSGATFGFAPISVAAGSVEELAHRGASKELAEAVARLASLCARARVR